MFKSKREETVAKQTTKTTSAESEPSNADQAPLKDAPSDARKEGFRIDVSRGFSKWLEDHKAGLAITTYRVGKVMFFGLDEEQGLWVFNRNVGRCLGLSSDETGFWVSSDTQLLRFENLVREGQLGQGGCDAYFAPRTSYYTGDLDIHDLAMDKDGSPVFVNTLFNCLAKPSAKHSFELVWQPPFITDLVAEDRCHLNGLAMRDGVPRYVTMVSQTDVYNGWRGHRDDGGVVMDVTTNKVICEGLSMPHSPRWHDGKLWLHNSGTGEFGHVDMKKKKFVPLAFCPGYLRGLDFIGDHAVVGLSKPRDENKTFTGLALDDRMKEKKVEAQAGLYFIDLKTGAITHSLVFEGIVDELYDVSVLNGVRKPGALGPLGEELKTVISLPN